MKRGVWHQLGDRSQKIVIEQLSMSIGSGVIISPRDLAKHKAIEYAREYHNLGTSVVIDQQFHVPSFTNNNLRSYETEKFRQTISSLNKITETELNKLTSELRIQHCDMLADAIIAPAIVYEAGRNDIVELNSRLFSAAKRVGDDLGIPTYATVILGRSANSSQHITQNILSNATALNSDGWYFGFEFSGQRIPNDQEQVYHCLLAGLILACSGKPVLHCYSGPMALLSMGFGATATAIGHSQNLWQFTRSRWQDPENSPRGGGDAPPRFFSTPLWGTVIYPDELIQIPTKLRDRIYTPSRFSPANIGVAPLSWNRWDANKHLLNQIGSKVTKIAANLDARVCANMAIEHLNEAQLLHNQLEREGIRLKDQTNTYQGIWVNAMKRLINNHATDFDYLELLS